MDASRVWTVVRSTRPIGVVVGLVTAALVCASGAAAQSRAATHASIRLIAENDSLEAAETSWIGLLFDLEKGWHIYWVNPGDSGGPPTIDWHVPPGFRAGEIRWPIPRRFVSGTQVDYGYEGRVLLLMPLQVPLENRSEPITLTADVKYLICREVCIPSKARVSLSMPVVGETAEARASRRELFRAARETWPKPLLPASKARVLDDGSTFVLSVETGTDETAAAFFPLEADQIDNGAPQAVSSEKGVVRITLRKSDQLQQPISTLKGLVVLGSGHGLQIAAPVAAKQ